MKQIAVLTCLQACNVCTGASCFRAWNDRDHSFAPYAEADAVLVAFFHCNGCDKDPETDRGMIEKLDRLQKIGADVVHTGVCTIKNREEQPQCRTIQKIGNASSAGYSDGSRNAPKAFLTGPVGKQG